jgi:signal transduction histidine kinase
VTSARRLSLRARMLVLLVGVTTALLLVMGMVSSYLLAHLVDEQITQSSDVLNDNVAHLTATCHRSVSSLCLNDYSAGDAIVLVPLQRDLTAVPVTHTTLTRRLMTAVDARLSEPGLGSVRQLAGRGELTAVTQAIMEAGCAGGTGAGTTLARRSAGQAAASFPYLNCQPFDVDTAHQIQTVSRLITAGPAGVIIPASAPQREAIMFVAQPVSTDPDLVREFIIAQLITGAALIALVAVAGEGLIGRGLEPLDEMAATANEITTIGDLTARMPDADDQTEVGRLGSSINTMLDRIQQAFSMRLHSEQKVREFAADASHELRTPLTTIRGYAELYRQGALGPDQLPGAMRRIEQEAKRMSTLVAELLELARLDRTSSLDLTETDLAAVVRDAVADAVAVQPQRPVRAEAPPRLVAVVDEPRVRQVIANLLGNVRAHTPPTTPVAVRLGAISGGVLIEVADAGPGMSAADAIRAFDRFHRAAERDSDGWSSGSGQDDRGSRPAEQQAERSGGSGLGLSIVAAIANAHGGRATLESRPGRGTKVRVWLPVRIVP